MIPLRIPRHLNMLIIKAPTREIIRFEPHGAKNSDEDKDKETNIFLEKLPYIESGKEYDKLMEKWGSESNGLENMFYHCFKGTRNVYWEDKEIFESKCNKAFIHKDYSRVEYFTILPLDSNRFVPFVQISNNNDSRRIEYTLIKNNNFVTTKYYDVTSRFHTWDIVNFYGTSLNRLPAQSVRTIIFWGEHDGIFNISGIELLKKHFPYSQTYKFSNAAHLLMLEQPSMVVDIYSNFLKH